MDKQENRATGAGGVVLSDEVLGAVVSTFEYLVIMAKGRPVRVVPA